MREGNPAGRAIGREEADQVALDRLDVGHGRLGPPLIKVPAHLHAVIFTRDRVGLQGGHCAASIAEDLGHQIEPHHANRSKRPMTARRRPNPSVTS